MSTPIRSGDGIDDPLIYAPRRARSRPDAPPIVPETSSGVAANPGSAMASDPIKKDAAAAATRSSAIAKPAMVPDAKPATGAVIKTPATPVAKSAAASIAKPSLGSFAKASAAPWLSDAPSMVVANLPAMAPGIGGPNIELPPPRLRPFEGDIAVQELRRRLSLDPQMALQAPVSQSREPLLPRLARVSFLVMAALTAAAGVTLLSNLQEARRQAGDAAAGAAPSLPEGSAAAGLAGLPPVKMIVESQRAFANEPLPLGIWLDDAAGTETLTMVGLAAGTRLSAGKPVGLTGWQISASDLGKSYAYAPKDFVGVMDASIDLRSRDRLVDSQLVRLEWIPRKEAAPAPALEPPKPAAAAIRPLDPQEIANLLKRGDAFVRSGDIPSARIALRRAASADSAQAMLALGMTFDPAYLSEQGVLGFAADTAQARAWYEKAMQLGSAEASRRLARLAKLQ